MSESPKNVVVNGEERAVSADTLAGLLEELDMDPRLVAVEHEGEVVARRRYAETRLEDGDRVEIVRFVQGG